MSGDDAERENERLRWVKACSVDGTTPLPEFEAVAELAARLLSTEIAIVTLITEREHVFLANHGGHLRRVPRHGLCNLLVESDLARLVVLDATTNRLCFNSPWVVGPPHLRFYAGVPLVVNGVRVGTLVVVDRTVRTGFTREQGRTLAQLGAIASAMLDRRCASRTGRIAEDLADAAATATVATDKDGLVTFWNTSAEALFGWPRHEMIGRSIERIMPERFRAAHASGMKRAVHGSRLSGSVVDLVGLHRNGTELAVGLSMSTWAGPDGIEFGGHMRDVSDRKAEELEWRERADRDHLTGLLNRGAFKARVADAIAAGGAAVLVIDVDGLKTVNDTLGHALGDVVLQTFALRLATLLPPGASAGRLGGDEFAILLPHDREARAIADLLLAGHLVAEPPEAADLACACGIGLAAAPLHAATASELVARADLAMLAGKQQGCGMRVFDPSLLHAVDARKRLNDEILLATRHGEWELHYQPQYDLADGRVSGMEALLRWRHPHRGLLAPAAFLAELEQHLVSVEVGRWVLDEACRQLRVWREAGLAVPRMGVNLFERQFRRSSLVSDVGRAVEYHALAPGDLEIEVTERIALDPSDAAVAALRALREAGVHIAFEDFGTGQASLTTVKQLPLSRLKIDKSFVRDVMDDRRSSAIVQGIASIGRALDLDIVAEGIEHPEQVAKLREAGCGHGQGYLFARPLPPGQVASLLASGRRGIAGAPRGGSGRPVWVRS